MVNSKIKIAYVCCINNFELYKQMKDSLAVPGNSAVYAIDNSTNKYTIPCAYNEIIRKVDSDVFVFIHQDILFPKNWHEHLIEQLEYLETMDNNWGVAGIMGVRDNGFFAGHIIDPHTQVKFGQLPCAVLTLDEVCLILRKQSNITFDEQLGGFHFYGADICLQALHLGMKCYAIDNPLKHLSAGKCDQHFYEMAQRLKIKWKESKIKYTIETTCGVFELQDGIMTSLIKLFKKMRRRIIRKIQKR